VTPKKSSEGEGTPGGNLKNLHFVEGNRAVKMVKLRKIDVLYLEIRGKEGGTRCTILNARAQSRLHLPQDTCGKVQGGGLR